MSARDRAAGRHWPLGLWLKPSPTVGCTRACDNGLHSPGRKWYERETVGLSLMPGALASSHPPSGRDWLGSRLTSSARFSDF